MSNDDEGELMGNNEVITLQPEIDPATGRAVYVPPSRSGNVAGGESVRVTNAPQSSGADMAIKSDAHRDLRLEDGVPMPAGADAFEPGQTVRLTADRFAADRDFDWARAEHAQDAGQALQIIDGELVAVGEKSMVPGQSVTLTGDRFAATRQENEEVESLVRSGTASKLIAALQPTSQLRSHFATDPGGWYLRTKPTPSFRDVLHTVILRRSATGLYHAHLWRFMQSDRGELKNVELNRWVGAHESLSAHHTHLYPGRNGESAILCLSQRASGGMPSLTGAVLQAAKWTDGMGYVVRGRAFPYRQ